MKKLRKRTLNHWMLTLLCVPVFGLIFATAANATCPDTAYWKLDEDAIGTYTDVIGGYDAVRGTNRAPELAADFKVGAAQQFDGATTGLDVAADAAGTGPFDWSGTADFTIEFWINRAAGTLSDNEVVIGRQGTSFQWWAGLWSTASGSGGKVAFILVDSDGKNGGLLTGSTALNDGTWHHVAIVRDGTNRQHLLYVDGALDSGATVTYSAGTYTGNFSSTSAALNIGWLNFTGGCCYFSGMLDELAVHNRALLDTEVLADFTSGDVSNAGYCGNIDPQIVSTAKTTATGGFRYVYDVNATGEPVPSYSLSSNPDPTNMTIGTTDGRIEWTPAATGSFDVTVSADNGGTPATQAFSIGVSAVASFDAGLIAYWRMDEDTIDTFVDGIGGYDAVRGTSKAPEQAVDFKVGAAQQFDGATTGLDVAADAAGTGPFDWSGNADLTIEFWINRASGTLSDNEVIIGRQGASFQWWAGLWSSGSGNNGKAAFIFVDSNGSNGGLLVGSTALNDGTWHHVAIVRDGTNRQHLLYVDGALDSGATVTYSAGTYTGNFSSTSAALNIGWLNFTGGCCYFSGMLDELAVFNTALADTVIQQHFDNGDQSSQGYYQLNSAPTAVNDTASVDEGGTLTLDAANGVLNNDSDPEGQPITAILVSTATHGQLVLNSDGSYTYTHDGSETTSDSFTYKANDGTNDSVTATVNITVNPQNDVPVISNGGASIPTTATVGTQYTYDFEVTDDDGPSATWTLANAPTGMAIDASTGVVTWTPASGTTTSGAVTVTVSDGTGQASETFTITVSGSSGSGGGGGGGGGGCFISTLNF